MNDLLMQNSILNCPEDLAQYRYSDKMFIRKFLRQFLTILLSNLWALILLNVDNFVVSRFVGESALNSVELLSPFVMVISSFSAILMNGTNYVLSKTFGLGSEEAIQRFFRAIVLLTVIFLIGITVIQIPLLYCMIGVYDVPPQIRDMMYLYAAGMIVSNSVSVVNVVCTYILIASGKAKSLLKLTVLESVLNAVLDLLFVPVCKMGVLGAGLGTAVACTARGVASVILVQKLFKVFPTKRVSCKKEMRKILSVGFPGTLTSLVSSLGGYAMSAIVANYGGQEAVTVVSVCALGGSFMALLANSFVQAGNSMTGLLIASREWKIVRTLHRKIMARCVLAVSAVALLLFAFPQIVFAIYKIPEYSDFQQISVRLYMLKYIAFSCGLCLTNMCVFCGKKNITVVTGILKVLLLAPTFILLGRLNENMFFLCYFICEAIPVCILSFVLARTLRRKTEESRELRRIHFSFRGSEAVDVSQKLGSFLTAQNVPTKIVNRLSLVCEEIGAYAKSGKLGGEPLIFLSAVKSENAVRVIYLDDGTPAILNKELTANGQVIGNYELIERMAEEFVYQNVGGMNHFIISFRL